MKKLLLLLLIISNSAYSQIEQRYENQRYPDKADKVSIFGYIEKADSLWIKYKSDKNQTVHIDFLNDRKIILNYNSHGRGIRLTEFYEDTVAVAFSFTENDSSFYLNVYEWFFGFKEYEEYWYTQDSTIEYWYYGNEETLKRILKVKTGKSLMKIQDITIKNYLELVNTKILIRQDYIWVLKEESDTINE